MMSFLICLVLSLVAIYLIILLAGTFFGGYMLYQVIKKESEDDRDVNLA
jgi:hypothetical protein